MKTICLWVWILGCAAGALRAQSDKIDSLEKVVARAGEDTVKARSLCRLCRELSGRGRLDEALKQGTAGLKLAQKLKDEKGLALCFHNLGNVYYNQGDYTRATEHYLKSLEIRQRIGDPKGMASCHNNLGVAYSDQGDYARATEHYLKGLAICERMG
ncbi:MAG: tetratricopeptide repeat protein, partial [Bacteroidia bacterium]|nr:tetratricopeptide repeat protein [Bacteroidia bacterium]MDW8334809.1 tetratricopeptide repeat protein [Bacteroidia bacterium]